MSTKTPSDVISQASHTDGQTNVSMAMTFNSLVPGEYVSAQYTNIIHDLCILSLKGIHLQVHT